MQDVRTLADAILRAIGAIDASSPATPLQANNCLETINSTYKGMLGREIGLPLDMVALTGATTGRPWSNYLCNLATGATLTLPATPQEGWRFGVKDAKGNFSSNNLTISPNNQYINGATANVTLSTNGYSASWFYRADAGWQREDELSLDDTIPLPVDMHGFLRDIVAVDHYPQFWPGQQPDAMLVGLAEKARASFVARYGGRRTSPRVQRVA
jgi:hypothetical protein